MSTCPYCLSPIEKRAERVRCPVCGVDHHAECWRANGKCSVYGCEGWQAWSTAINEKIAPRIADKIDVEFRGTGRRAVQDNPLCIECGQPVKPGQMTCARCRKRRRARYLDNCLGPSVIVLAALVGLTVLLFRGLL